MSAHDLVIRGGTVFDGSGGDGVEADVAIDNGRISAIGRVAGRGGEEIGARGQIVTPGFVDIHTHYDGQVTWEDRTAPSSAHGVTTAVMGNCGVGFAPCRPQDRERLLALMEGVEDVPGIVMADGVPWAWESFEEYMDFVAARPRDIDVAAQLPHACLRIFVMGERAAAQEPATEADRQAMAALAASAARAGAIGFATSRSLFHRDRDGIAIPTKEAEEAELHAIAKAFASDGGDGVIEALIDFNRMDTEFDVLKRVSQASGLPLSFTVAQSNEQPLVWRDALDRIEAANREGVRMRGQVIGRPTGLLVGLNLSFNPFFLNPTYQKLADLPLPQRLAEMRKPEVRSQILGETPERSKFPVLRRLQAFHTLYVLGDPPNYEPDPADSIAAQAQRMGVPAEELAYDLLTAGDGKTVFFMPSNNYADGNLDAVLAMLKHEHTVVGLGDGGAHYGMICDAGYPTFMLTYWTRDRKGERLSLGQVVRQLAADTAHAVGLHDRGRVRIGLKADLNVIDYDRLRLHAPDVRFDLPANGRRVVQAATGYTATIVGGQVTYREGEATQALPGRLVRRQHARN